MNEYRFYVYDFLIGTLITIDTEKNRTRLDSKNIYGQYYTFGENKWEKVTKATINRAIKRSGYVYDDFIKEHFTNREKSLESKVLFKSNYYNECIKFIAEFGKKTEYT